VVRIYQVKPWLTASAINTYLWCPRKFYYKYVEKRKEKPKSFFVFGKAVHKIPEHFFKEQIFDKSKDYSEVRTNTLNLLTRKWRKQKPEIDALKLDQTVKDQNYLDAQKMTLNWLHFFLNDKTKDLNPKVEFKTV
jgi:CRISPR/Cas system-associated exonuclease Cas4 (RecB family)